MNPQHPHQFNQFNNIQTSYHHSHLNNNNNKNNDDRQPPTPTSSRRTINVNNLTLTNAIMTAKLNAARGFRRRSYDDQEGDNDINIILQPGDLEDIEQETRAKYARYLANRGMGDRRFKREEDASNDQDNDDDEKQRNNFNRFECETTSLLLTTTSRSSLSDASPSTPTTLTTSRTKAMKTSKFLAMTNIFNDVKLANCLLDQEYNQTVHLFIKKCALNWNFNSFTFDAMCCGRSLTELLLHLFDYYNLYKIFKLDIVKVLKCFRLLEFGYHPTNPYHNSVHAADVTQAMHCFIQEKKIKDHMTDLEILCSILAAVCHDLDHPGVNQSFLVATNNPLASLYQNNSVLENHHWRFALCIFKESKLFDHFSNDLLDNMKEQLKHLILATDIARQNDYLKRFKDLTSSSSFSMENTDDRALVLQMALKCADLGNPCRPWLISRVWSNLICDEFYRMGQIERRLGVPLTPICQREKTSIAGIQTDFFRFIVLPLLELWHKFLASPLSDLLMSNFDHNYKRWQRANRIVQQLRRRKSVACLEPVPDNDNIEGDETPTIITTYDDTSNAANHHTQSDQPPTELFERATSKLLFDPSMESYYVNHPFGAIKRATSDYIKSGNGKLELLRDFQLDRIIERSPLMSKSGKFSTKTSGSTSKNQEEAPQQQQQQHEDQRKEHQTGKQAESHTTAAPMKSDEPAERDSGQRLPTAGDRCKRAASGCKSWASSSSSTSRDDKATSGCSRPDQGCCQQTTGCVAPTQQPAAVPTRSEHLTYRKTLSPIQDGEGASPESPEVVGAAAVADTDRSRPLEHRPTSKGCKREKQATAALLSGGGCCGESSSSSSSSSSSASVSRSVSRASSACSSPIMQRSASIEHQLLNKQQHIKQHQQQRTTPIQNHPYLAQFYEPSGGTKLKPAHVSQHARQSVTTTHPSKALYNNKRRESDPGCLTDNYELAAAIVLIQYQSNKLFHKRRSSLPVCVPKRRSSK